MLFKAQRKRWKSLSSGVTWHLYFRMQPNEGVHCEARKNWVRLRQSDFVPECGRGRVTLHVTLATNGLRVCALGKWGWREQRP